MLAKLGRELTADLYVNSSWRDRTPTDVRRIDGEPAASSSDEDDEDDEEVDPEGGNSRLTSALASDLRAADFRSARVADLLVESQASSSGKTGETPVAPLADLQEADAFRPGSNNWVVSGQHTVSGKPLLSNDMHLNHQMPNLWFEAHLKTTPGNFDVAGVTLPGIPFVIVGHNQRIGWGFTNVGPTVEDDFIEEFNAQGQYKTPAGWRDAQHRREGIPGKGKLGEARDVGTKPHGANVSDLLPTGTIPCEAREIALRRGCPEGVGRTFFH